MTIERKSRPVGQKGLQPHGGCHGVPEPKLNAGDRANVPHRPERRAVTAHVAAVQRGRDQARTVRVGEVGVGRTAQVEARCAGRRLARRPIRGAGWPRPPSPPWPRLEPRGATAALRPASGRQSLRERLLRTIRSERCLTGQERAALNKLTMSANGPGSVRSSTSGRPLPPGS